MIGLVFAGDPYWLDSVQTLTELQVIREAYDELEASRARVDRV